MRAKPTLNKWFALALITVMAAVGTYLLFFAHAAVPANCVQVPGASDGQGICVLTQASKEDDGLVSNFSETDVLGTQGWWNMGPVFKAPNYPKNGALPVYRFYRSDITAHFLFIKDSPEYNTAANDAHYQFQGLAFYAWPNNTEPGTVPIERIDRGPTYFATLYFSSRAWSDAIVQGNNTWSYHDGVNGSSHFYAYPMETKDANCDTVGLHLGDAGNCVATLKANLRGFGNGNVKFKDEGSLAFDGDVDNYVAYFNGIQRSGGINVDKYNGSVTKSIWDAIASKPTPPKPVTAPFPTTTQPAPTATAATGAKSSTTAPTTVAKNIVAPAASKSTAIIPCPTYQQISLMTDANAKNLPSYCIAFAQNYAKFLPVDGTWRSGLQAAVLVAIANESKTGPVPIKALTVDTKYTVPTASYTPKGPNIDTKLGATIQSLPPANSRNAVHVNAWVYNGNNVGSDWANKTGNWDEHYICDVYAYPLGNNGVWVYARPEEYINRGGDSDRSCTFRLNKGTGKSGSGVYADGDGRIQQELRNSYGQYRKIVHWTGPGTAGVN